MADLEDLNAVGMHLERLHTDGHFTAILPVLDRLASARVCLGDLRQTAIARCVSGLERGSADASVRAKARSLLRSWNRVCALSCDPEAEGQSSPETKRNKWLPDGLCHSVGHNRTASDGDESQGGGCADFGDESCARLTIDASSHSLQQHLKDVYMDQNLSVPTTGGDNAETTNLTVCELSGGNSLMATVSENVNSCAQSGNVNLCAQSGNVDSCAQSGNVDSCAKSGNVNSCAQSGNVDSCAQSGNVNSCAQSGNVNLCAQSGNVDSCAQSGNVDSCAKSGNVNSCAQSGNVDSCAQSGNVDSCAQSGNVNLCAQSGNVDSCAQSGNVDSCAKSGNVNSCAQSGNVDSCAQSGNVDSCAQSGNVDSCAQSGNVDSCAQSGNVDSCAQSGNVDSCAQSGNVDSCAQSGNVDSCAQSGNVNSCAQSGNVDSCAQSGNVDSCAQSGNVNSCAQALKADTVTGKVNVTRCNRTETDPHANELPEDVNIKPTQACSMHAVREKGIQLLYKGLLGIDTRSVAPSGSCKPFCGSANNIAECPELSRESTETLGSHSLSGDVKSCVVHGSAGERRTGPHSPDSSVVETEPAEEESKGDKTHLIELAKEIERAIFGLHPSVDKKYRACLRSKIANLRHPQNGELAGRVRAGAVSPAQFAAMTPEEMACSELRHLRHSYQQAALREHQLPHRPGGTRTDRVRCRRCGKFNCSVSVVCRGTLFIPGWVRGDSPDEQLMTFLTCEECGEKWYNAGWMVT